MTAMAVPAYQDPRPSPLRDLGDITFDARELFCAIGHFPTLGELRAYLLLKLGVLTRGELPTGKEPLARIARMSVKRFEGVEDDLGLFFDRDAGGRWTDHRIARARDSRIELPTDHAPASKKLPDPVRRAINAANGARGGLVTQSRRRGETITLEAADAAQRPDDRRPAAGETASEKVGSLHFASSEPKQIEATSLAFASPVEANSLQLASKLAISSESYSSKLASDGRASASDPEATGQANRQATDQAKPRSELDGAGQANGGPSDAAMVEAVVQACGGKVGRPEARLALPAFRATMADGVDFTRHIVPKIRSFARRYGHIDNVANKHILGDARALAASEATPDLLGPVVDRGVWIEKGGVPYTAWCRREGKTSLVSYQVTKRHTEGCCRPTEWPPDG